MENIKLGVKLGHGSQAEVFKAKYGLDDVVVKRFLDSTHEDSRRELGIVKQLHNRHIVQFYHVQQDMLVMEYAEGGSLTDAILSGVIVNWDTKTRIAKQVALGLAYLHLLNIIHCDLKSANIVLTMHGDAKICDFGRARMVGQSGGHGGTLPWMAPELFLNPPQYSTKSDVYALGMVMWEMASGCTQPYQEHTHDGVVDCITNGYTEEIPDDTPGAYAACIHECWHQEPEERLAAVDILPDIKIVSPDLNVDDLGSPEDEYDDDLRFISQA
ncbi:kinase-like domain-containing protein, partial [Dissophora ornata]